MNVTRNVVVAAIVMLLATPCFAQAWHAAGWSHRAVILVEPAGEEGGDVGWVRIHHDGLAAKNADDLRVFDEAGKSVPYEVTFHDPARVSMLSFRAAGNGAGRYFVYFGKGGAARDPMRTLDTPLGQGPPKPGPGAGGWIPRTGIVLATHRRPEEAENPRSVSEMLALVAASPEPDGASYRTGISDGLNPFGNSDYYISIYRGWIHVPAPGTYSFCTASNEASFSFLDGKDLVHWPGRHTEDRGRRGQYNATVTLTEGPHYVEYLHEEVQLYQMAFLGWKAPGDKIFGGIPIASFPRPRPATVQCYETAPGQRTVVLHPQLVDNVWPKHRSFGQFTRYRFTADGGVEAQDWNGWTFKWDFGDGITGTGASAEHVYLQNGRYSVSLDATGPQGQRVKHAWPLVVFPIEHLAGPYKESRISEYAPIVKTYDAAQLSSSLLGEYVRFTAESGDSAAAQRMSDLLLKRPDADKRAQAEAHLIIIGDAGLSTAAWDGTVTPEQAPRFAEHLRAAIGLIDSPSTKLVNYARLIRVLGIDRSDLAAAEAAYAEAQPIIVNSKKPRASAEALHEVHVAIGDAYLWSRRLDKAALGYGLAEQLAESPLPPAVRAAKSGAYPEDLQQHVAKRQFGQARLILQEWLDELPSDQMHGDVLFWLGKVRQFDGQSATAIRPLKLAIDLAEGAEYEAEARWLLAQALKQSGDVAGSNAALKALIASGLKGPYRQQAAAALQEK